MMIIAFALEDSRRNAKNQTLMDFRVSRQNRSLVFRTYHLLSPYGKFRSNLFYSRSEHLCAAIEMANINHNRCDSRGLCRPMNRERTPDQNEIPRTHLIDRALTEGARDARDQEPKQMLRTFSQRHQ